MNSNKLLEDIGTKMATKRASTEKVETKPPFPKKAKANHNSQLFEIGTKIIKHFDLIPYTGHVISYDAKSKFYKIMYGDGDEEEFDTDEVKRYCVASTNKEENNKSSNHSKQRKFGPVSGKITNVAKIDDNIFLRNPCRVPGGKQHPPRKYGNSGSCTPLHTYYYLMQRLSDRNYTMRGLCVDGDGLQYTSFKKPSVINKCIVFLPDTNLNDHHDNPYIMDGCHLDLICPTTGECFLKAKNLLKVVTPNTQCIFINGYQFGGVGGNSKTDVDPNAIVEAINTCKENLLCFSLTESILTNGILIALSKCKKLRGIILSMTQNNFDHPNRANDDGLKLIIRACHDLRWLFVEETSMLFRNNCWKALDNKKACPNLEVLWISSYKNVGDRHHVIHGDRNIVRKVLNERSSTLKHCMINPDEKLKSRFIIGKKTDRLEGDEYMNVIQG